MNHADAFAGIGGFGLAAKRAGWRTVWAAEIEPAARAIYSARLGHDGLRFDTDITESRDMPGFDILTGGFPCQDLSVAGKREGLAGKRSSLFYELVRILEESRPRWFVFENVPGLLSSNGGRDFAAVLHALGQCGYGVSWRVLNAQFWGVAQRRRRVFIVGCLDDWRRAAAVLFEPDSGTGNSSPRREKREAASIAACLNTGGAGGGFRSEPGAHLVASAVTCHEAKGGDPTTDNYIVAPTLRCGGMADAKRPAGSSYDNTPLVAHSLSAEGHDASEDETGRGTPIVIQDINGTRLKKQNGIGISSTDTCYTLTKRDRHAVAFNWQSGGSQSFVGGTNDYTDALGRCQTPAVALSQNQRGEVRTGDVASALGVGGGKPGQGYPCAAIDSDRMRAATGLSRSLDVCPVCADGPDSPRYRALGNSVAVPVIEWIFSRINQQEVMPPQP